MLTKKHFIRAAELVHAIVDGDWSDEPPGWAEASLGDWQGSFDETQEHYTRAVQLAEVFIHWFREENPRFDQVRFLVACGLGEPQAVHGRNKGKLV